MAPQPSRLALLWNLVSALTFPLGAVLAHVASWRFDVAGLVPVGAGHFIYIAASDLIPEIKAHASLRSTALHFSCFAGGLALTAGLAYWLGA